MLTYDIVHKGVRYVHISVKIRIECENSEVKICMNNDGSYKIIILSNFLSQADEIFVFLLRFDK